MRLEISRLHQQLGITTVYVTHDQIEAMTLADRIVVLNEGVIMQAGSPRELYNRPQNLFVAEFIGSPKMNLLKCEAEKGKLRLQSSSQDSGIAASHDNVAWVGVRPEDITVGAADGAAISGTVAVCEYLGSEQFAFIDCGFEEFVTVRVDPNLEFESGARVGIGFAPERIHSLINRETGCKRIQVFQVSTLAEWLSPSRVTR